MKPFQYMKIIIHSDTEIEDNFGKWIWDENAEYSYGIQHGGNHLHGTEFRRPAQHKGAWVRPGALMMPQGLPWIDIPTPDRLREAIIPTRGEFGFVPQGCRLDEPIFAKLHADRIAEFEEAKTRHKNDL
jgi:hypothetical protein